MACRAWSLERVVAIAVLADEVFCFFEDAGLYLARLFGDVVH